jgi:hypothetical protein
MFYGYFRAMGQDNGDFQGISPVFNPKIGRQRDNFAAL